jgi:hypothetical protein
MNSGRTRPKPPEPKDTRDGLVPGGMGDGRLLLWLFAIATVGIVAALARSGG